MIEPKAPAVFYAWIGFQEGAEFDADDSRAVTAVVTSPPEEAEMKVTSVISRARRLQQGAYRKDRADGSNSPVRGPGRQGWCT